MVSMATNYVILRNRDIPTKSIISQLLLILENRISYQIKAKTQGFYQIVHI